MWRASVWAATVVLVSATTVAPASAAPAAVPAVVCHDGARLAHRSIGELDVDHGRCTVIRVSIGGQGVAVSTSGTRLTALSSTVHGPMTLGFGTSVQLSSSTVDGGIYFDPDEAGGEAAIVTVLHSAVHDGMVGSVGELTVRDSSVDGRFYVQPFETSLNGDHFRGLVTLQSSNAIVQHTTIDGSFDASGGWGLQACDVRINGPAAISQARQNTARLGSYADPATPCPFPTVIDGDVNVNYNFSVVDLDNVVIHGNLTCMGNYVTPVLGNVVVTGERTGQCAPAGA